MISTKNTAGHTINKESATSFILLFLSLSIAARTVICGALIVACLFFFTLIIDAISEIVLHLAQIYSTSDSITRLVIFVLAVLFCRKVFPYAARIFKGI